MPSPHVTVTNTLLNTRDASTTTGLDDIGDGTSWALSVDTTFRLGRLPGGLSFLGTYAFDGEFDEIGGINITPGKGITVDRKDSAWAVQLSGWQYVYTEEDPPEAVDPGDGRQDLEGLGVFAILGLGDEDTNPVSWSVAGGLSGRGSIPGRGDDTWGVGYYYNSLQEPDSLLFSGLADSVHGFEAYYRIAVAPSVSLTLDGQWMRSAIRGVDDSTVLGLRMEVRF
jgi:hypothetical protein